MTRMLTYQGCNNGERHQSSATQELRRRDPGSVRDRGVQLSTNREGIWRPFHHSGANCAPANEAIEYSPRKKVGDSACTMIIDLTLSNFPIQLSAPNLPLEPTMRLLRNYFISFLMVRGLALGSKTSWLDSGNGMNYCHTRGESWQDPKLQFP